MSSRISLRAVWPGILTVGLFAVLYAWNDFPAPLFLSCGRISGP
ncbi:hypothetical protein [Jiangella asiatica]|nr:hypothetical protein [Jiangella asiatica]